MARIHPGLIPALMKKLGLGQARVYKLIQTISAKNRLPRHLGALLLAGDNGISFQKYASADDLRDLRGIGSHIEVDTTVVSPSATPKRGKAKAPPKPRDNSVFVVHGRDSKLNEAMYGFLRAIGLKPKEFSQVLRAAKGPNPNVGQAIYDGMESAHGVVVMFSPDEQAKLKTKFAGPKDKKFRLHELDGQARPNVIFEAGLALGAHAQKTIMVQIGDTRDISDLAGKHMMHLSNDPASRSEFVERLKTKLGFKVDTTGSLWLSKNFDFDR